MGQEEVLEFLEKIKKPVAASDIVKELNKNFPIIFHALKALIKTSEIKIIEINREQAMKLYKCKRRMRLYYV